MKPHPRVDEVLQFWFGAPAVSFPEHVAKMQRWFRGGPELDAEATSRFAQTVDDAIAGKLDGWLDHPKGWLALVIVLDQLTRNVLRNSPRMYEGDARAQALAIDGLDSGRTHALPLAERHFAVMPLVHSEQLAHQERGVIELARLVDDAPAELRPIYAMGIEQTTKYRAIITRFGRFPHRNAILGRPSTPEETEFLRDWATKQPPSGAAKLMGG